MAIAGLALFLVLAMFVWTFRDGGQPLVQPHRLSIPSASNGSGAIIRSMQQLWGYSPETYPPQDELALVQMADSVLDDQGWRCVSASVYFFWENLRRQEDSQVFVRELNRILFPRFARTGMLSEGESLIRAAIEKAPDSVDLERTLIRASSSLPEGRFWGSPCSVVVAASFKCQDYARAQSYLRIALEGVSLPETTRAELAMIERLAVICREAKAGSYDIIGAMQGWAAMQDYPLACLSIRPELVTIGYSLVQSNCKSGTRGRLDQILGTTVAEEGTGMFWQLVVDRCVQTLSTDSKQDTSSLDELCKAYQVCFQRPNYAAETWLKVGIRERSRYAQTPSCAVASLERALESAQDPNLADRIAGELIRIHLLYNDSAKAQQVAEKALSLAPEDTNRRRRLNDLILGLPSGKQ